MGVNGFNAQLAKDKFMGGLDYEQIDDEFTLR